MALESPDKDAKYIHIAEATPDTTYYCPCCRGKVLPRAIINNKKYKVQAHFYHENGGCREEEYVHFICKNWLFEPNFEFRINNIIYSTKNIVIEKSYSTTFGLYCPDITIKTQEGRIFFVEIRNKNKKDITYVPKWDELGVDVIEIDIRDVINKKVADKIPEFQLIYSDGICHIKSYVKKQYIDTILKRKQYWKESDRSNYVQQWKSLDMFWHELYFYKRGEIVADAVMQKFNEMEYDDRLWATESVVKKMSCQDLYPQLKEELNKSFYAMLDNLSNSYKDKIPTLEIHCKQTSPQIHIVQCKYTIKFMNYSYFDFDNVRLKCSNGILPVSSKVSIESQLDKLAENYHSSIRQLTSLLDLCPNANIGPISHYCAETIPISNLLFKVEFQDFIHNKYIMEPIGQMKLSLGGMNEKEVEKKFKSFRRSAIKAKKNMIIKHALKNNSTYQNALVEIKNLCCDDFLDFKVSSDYTQTWLLYKNDEVLFYECKHIDFVEVGNEIYNFFAPTINYYKIYDSLIDDFINKVNKCPNGLWQLRPHHNTFGVYWELIFAKQSYEYIYFDSDTFHSPLPLINQIQEKVFLSMKQLADGIDSNIRIME